MASVKIRDDLGFDIDRAQKSIESYSHSVGTACIVIDASGKTLYHAGKNKGICKFCSKIQSLLNQNYNCQNAHLYGSYQAERFSGKYIFFCPIGLVHWASPITKDGIMKGAVLGGPVMMIEPEEFLLDDIMTKSNIDPAHIEELIQYINEIPIIQPDVVNHLSDLLFIVAAFISGERLSQHLEDRDSQEQQSNILNYIHYINTMGGDESSIKSYPLEKEKELISLISRGDKEGSQRVLNEILGHIFFSSEGNFEVIKARVLELVVVLSRAALEGGADVELIFGLNYKYLTQVHDFQTLEELALWLTEIMTRFTDCVINLTEVKHIDVIYKAVDYIKRNYTKKITLEEVASRVHLSPSYFSKVFNDELKCSFNNYLNNIRIETSKKLLMNDSIPLVDVSSCVGFEDQSYFSKVFKKVVGISPGKFRETRGKFNKL